MLLLVILMLLMLVVLPSDVDAVPMTVPLTKDISKVDVEVIVMVRPTVVVVSRSVVIVPFRASEKIDPAGLSSEVELVVGAPDVSGVGGGVVNVS